MLYSDGITEASSFNQEEYASDRLREHALNPLASSESNYRKYRTKPRSCKSASSTIDRRFDRN